MIKLLIGVFLGVATTAIADDFIDLTRSGPPVRFVLAGGRDSKGIPRAFYVNEAGEVRCETK